MLEHLDRDTAIETGGRQFETVDVSRYDFDIAETALPALPFDVLALWLGVRDRANP